MGKINRTANGQAQSENITTKPIPVNRQIQPGGSKDLGTRAIPRGFSGGLNRGIRWPGAKRGRQ
jgi:hypothetical protein